MGPISFIKASSNSAMRTGLHMVNHQRTVSSRVLQGTGGILSIISLWYCPFHVGSCNHLWFTVARNESRS